MPMKKMILLCLCGAFLFAGCTKNNPVAPSASPMQGQMRMTLAMPDEIASGKVTITKGSLTHSQAIAMDNHVGSVMFGGIQVGTWHIQVQLFDQAEVEIYSGASDASVKLNTTTTLTIRVNRNTGNLEVVIEIPEANETAVLKGFWKLEGNALDMSGNGNNGTVPGSLAFAPGVSGQAANFNGVDGACIDIPNADYFNNMQTFTIESWIFPTQNSAWNTIVSKVTPNRDFGLAMWDNGKLDFYFAIDSADYYHCLSDEVIPLNQWSHVVGIWTGTKLQLYINGVLAKERDCGGQAPAWTGTRMAIGTIAGYSPTF